MQYNYINIDTCVEREVVSNESKLSTSYRLSSVMADPKPYVLMFQDDFKRIKDWVLEYPDRETGGQFFGLWTHNKNPYINIVIGPGQGCRHETHSFHQDIPYFENVGTFLNGEFMMCHIGEWHSHHRLRLRKPSSGDLNSIWKHFPSGIERFLLVIATIESNDDVKLWPWLFTASNHEHNLIDLKIIEKDNVFMIDEDITNRIAKGAEKRKIEPKYSSGTHHSLWFHSSLGASFVQHLHSELDTFVKAGDEIKKTLDAKGLEFSFPHHKFHWVLLFPPSFPRCGVTIKRQSKKYSAVTMVNHANDNPYDGLVNQLVRYIRQLCDWCQNGEKSSTVFYSAWPDSSV